MYRIANTTKEERETFLGCLESLTLKSSNTIKDLRIIDPICTAIEKSKGNIDLENAEFDFLKKRFEGFESWNPAKVHRERILSVGEKLDKAEKLAGKPDKESSKE